MKMRKVCMFGDSVGKGVVYDEGKNRYSVLKESFAATLSARLDVDIDNFSSFGCTMTKGCELVERHIDRLKDYDAVLLEFGGNDCDFDWSEVARRPWERHECKTPLRQFVEGYTALIDKIRRVGGRPVMLTVPAVNAEKFFNWISRGRDADAIMKFLREKHRIEHWNELYNNAVWSIASAEKVPVIDIRSPILYERDFEDLFCEDGIHLNSEGHRLISEQLFDELKGLAC